RSDFRIRARCANALRSRCVWVCVAAGQRRSTHVGSVGPWGAPRSHPARMIAWYRRAASVRADAGSRDGRGAMRVVVALGGNALLRRGQAMTPENQVQNVAAACDHLAPIAEHHELVVSHGNGPQIGLLALEQAAYKEAADSPMDVLGA